MITPEQLRVGNFVHIYGSEEIVIIQGINPYGHAICQNNVDKNTHPKYNDLYGIPVSDETLSYFNLPKFQDPWDDFPSYSLNGFTIYLFEGYYRLVKTILRKPYPYGRQLIYLHEVQNLYYATTGQELLINRQRISK